MRLKSDHLPNVERVAYWATQPGLPALVIHGRSTT